MNITNKKIIAFLFFSIIILSNFYSESRRIKNISLHDKSTEYILKHPKKFQCYYDDEISFNVIFLPSELSFNSTSTIFESLLIAATLENNKSILINYVEINEIKIPLSAELKLDREEISFDNIFSNGFKFWGGAIELPSIDFPKTLKKITVKINVTDNMQNTKTIELKYKLIERSIISRLFDYL